MDKAKEAIVQKLKASGCRITKQRRMLLDIILEENCSCCKEIYYRASRIDPLRSALKRGIPFTSHNDTSVTPMDPLLSVWSAVNRLTGSGKVLGEDQTVSVLDALKSVTIWGAYQFHEERMKGSLEPGKLADMVILGENPLEIAPERIRDIPVLATLVGNRLVYGSL